MVYSMTGYGRDNIHIGTTTITVEIRSVNHRYLDVSIETPQSLLFLEDDIKKFIQTNFRRGRIEVYVRIEDEHSTGKHLLIDWKLLDQYVDTFQQVKDRYKLSGNIPISMITHIPELISIKEATGQSDELISSIFTCIEQTCAQVLTMRKQEGNYIIKDIQARVHTIKKLVLQIRERKTEVQKEYQNRIIERIEVFVSDDIIDNRRLHQEIAFLIEKGDIAEEIIRLLSHIEHFYKILKEDDAVGRMLDFIVQEMHREINTIGSKAIDISTSEWIILLKREVEKIREQIQNIE